MSTLFRPALTLFVALTLVTGVAYPLVVTGIAQVAFPTQAGGSILTKNGAPVGSTLIGQSFSDPKHFWSRPSATSPQPYNGLASGGSNLGPLNPALTDGIKTRIDALHSADPGNNGSIPNRPVPIDLVTASASGLDPDISLAAAYYQAPRVARERGLAAHTVETLITAHARGRWLGILGEPRVNVLELNLALDAMH
jgi:K+-transporting ATPase ATPase C chain